MKTIKDALGAASGTAAGVADRIGPRRGLIGLGILAVVIGGAILAVRLVRKRRAEAADRAVAGALGVEPEELAAPGERGRNARRGGLAQARR